MQLTIRGVDPELEAAIRRLAQEEGISLNKAALRILERGARLDRRQQGRIGRDLDHLFGTWSAAEAERFLSSVQSCEQIDEGFWK